MSAEALDREGIKRVMVGVLSDYLAPYRKDVAALREAVTDLRGQLGMLERQVSYLVQPKAHEELVRRVWEDGFLVGVNADELADELEIASAWRENRRRVVNEVAP